MSPSVLSLSASPVDAYRRIDPGASQKSTSEKIHELSQQFEAVILRQLLKQARSTTVSSDLVKPSFSSGIYNDLMNDHLADAISQSGAFGLSSVLQTQLSRQLASQETEGSGGKDARTRETRTSSGGRKL